MKKIILTFLSIILTLSVFNQNVFFPPEFEKQEGLLLTWDYNDQRNPITAAIAKAVQPSAKVWIIYYPGQAPMDTSEIRDYLRQHSVPDQNVNLIPGWTETLWIRDYGPFSGYDLATIPVSRMMRDAGYSAYNRPMDDSIPTQIANYWEIPVGEIPLQFEGGNVLFDGLGRAWGSSRIIEQNPAYTEAQLKALLEEYFGLYDFMFLQKLTHSGGGIWCHVDMFMKILDQETILISQYPDFVPDYNIIENFASTLAGMANSEGRNYTIIRIPAPPKADGNWPTTQNDEMRTYTNSIIINNVIVVPSYNLPEYDSTAKHVYQQAMPGYRIEMVDATALTPLYGALHCITHEVTKPQYFRVQHNKIVGLQEYSGKYFIHAKIDCTQAVDSVFLYYKLKHDPQFTRVEMWPGCPYHTGLIINNNLNDTIHYYISATHNGDQVFSPPQAPEGFYTFWCQPTTGNQETSNLAQSEIRIFPNPSNGEFSLDIQSETGLEGEVSINDLTGKIIYNQLVCGGKNQFNLVHLLKPGIYVLKFIKPNQQPHRRILVIEK